MIDFLNLPRRHGDTKKPQLGGISPCLRASVVNTTNIPFPQKTLLKLIIFLLLLSSAACQQVPYREGGRLYKANCANCHMDDGVGLGALIPPIAGADYLQTHRERLPCILKYGMKDSVLVNGQMYAEQMPGVPTLSVIQITNILNFINHNWGNDNPVYRLDEVERLLEGCE